MQLEEIKKKKQQLYQIAAKYGISRIYVFGSVARGESREVSDIDFLIEMSGVCSVRKVRLSCYLNDQKNWATLWMQSRRPKSRTSLADTDQSLLHLNRGA